MIIYEKRLLTSVLGILPINFCFVSPCCFFSIYKHYPEVTLFLLIVALKRAVFFGWEEQLDEGKLICSSC